ncbi:hypothetical protein ASE31_12805 [Acidovorax sp. Root217]|nr:hypothetical protein ASE31_12805 [Acidovorax sp. Root217]
MNDPRHFVGIVPPWTQPQPKILTHQKMDFSCLILMRDSICRLDRIADQTNTRRASIFLKIVEVINIENKLGRLSNASESFF